MDHDHLNHGNSALMWMPSEPPTWWRLFAWNPQPVPLTFLLAVLALLFYGWCLLRLRARGKSWPIRRTVAFVLGFVSIVLMAGTAFNGYSMALFSVHMVQHMVLSMLTPPLILAGQPATLALRAFAGTGFGRWLEGVLSGRVLRLLTWLPVSLVGFLALMYGFYFTPIFDVWMANWFTHELMLILYVVSGILLFWPILDFDPSPHHISRPLAFLASVLPVPFHSFFAVIVMQSEGLLVQTFAHPIEAWGISPLRDQALGGGLAWAFADIPGLVLIILIALQWQRESRAEAAEYDHEADADGDAELERYNAWLAGQADVDRAAEPR